MGQIEGLPHVNGIGPADIWELTPDLQPVLRHMLRHPMTLNEMASELQLSPDQAHIVANKLVDKGYLISEERADFDGPCYKVYFARTHSHQIPAEL